MKQQVEPVRPMTLAEQYENIASALSLATSRRNHPAMQGLSILLRSYEEAIKEANHRADQLASGVHPDVYEASRKWNI
jgi:hypothetical protein